MASKYKNEIGNVYGKLTVSEFSHTDKKNAFWKCSCSCGGNIITRGNTLRSGQCKSCGNCDIQRKPSDTAVFKRYYRGVKNGANSRNLEFDLSFENYMKIVKDNCYHCGLPPHDKHYLYSRRRYSKGIENDLYEVFNGIDRMDSSKGYINDNIVSCCFTCNRIKSDLNNDVFLQKVKEIYEYAKKTGKY